MRQAITKISIGLCIAFFIFLLILSGGQGVPMDELAVVLAFVAVLVVVPVVIFVALGNRQDGKDKPRGDLSAHAPASLSNSPGVVSGPC